MSDVIVDCEKCDKRFLCCRHTLRVQLEPDEVEKYKCEPAIKERKDIHIVAHENGLCYYFNPFTRKCKIWDQRPKTCREYDCKTDPRVEEILAKSDLQPLPTTDQKYRVCISVAILFEKDERKVSPMMTYSNHGPTAADVIEIRGNGEQLIKSAKMMLEHNLREQLIME